MDPQGILMLNSIREIFDITGISFESMLFIEAKFNDQNSIIDAIDNQRLCPAIVGAKFNFSACSIDCVHVMVAAGTSGWTKQEYFIQCKNSYRDDTNQSGKFHQRYLHGE